jgi:hypothetical protein
VMIQLLGYTERLYIWENYLIIATRLVNLLLHI